MRKAEMPDGTILEFPDETPDAVIDQKAKEYIRGIGLGKKSVFDVPSGQPVPRSLIDRPEVAPGEASAGLRTKISFADSPEGEFNFLQRQFGAGNVSRVGDRLIFRKTAEEPFRFVDEPGFTFKDVLDITGQVPEIALGTAGAVAGTVAGGPGGGVVGAGVGAGAGEAVRQGIGSALGVREGFKPERVLTSTAFGLAGQAGGTTIAKIIQKAMAPAAKSFLSNLDIVRGAEKRGLFLSPAEQTGSKTQAAIEQLTSKSIVGRGIVQRFQRGQARAVNKFADDLVEGFGDRVSREEVGLVIKEAIENSEGVFKESARGLFREVDEGAQGILVDVREVKALARKIRAEQAPKETATKFVTKQETGPVLDQFGKPITRDVVEAVSETRELFPSLKSKTGASILDDIENLPDFISFEDAQQGRSLFLGVGRQGTEAIPGQAQGAAKGVAAEMDRAMINAARQTGGDLEGSFRAANAFWKRGKDLFNKSLVAAVAKKDPEIIVDAIFRPGRVTGLKAVKKVVDAETYRKLKAGFIQKMMEKATTDDPTFALEKIARGRVFKRELGKFGDAFLKEAFSPEELKNLKEFADISSRVGASEALAANPSGTGQSLIAFTELGLLVKGAARFGTTGDLPIYEGAILLSLPLIAKVMTSPGGIKWLTRGFRIPATGKEAITLGTRIIAAASKPEPESETFSVTPRGPAPRETADTLLLGSRINVPTPASLRGAGAEAPPALSLRGNAPTATRRPNPLLGTL